MVQTTLGKVRKQIKKLEKDYSNDRITDSEYRLKMRNLRAKERGELTKKDDNKHGKKVSDIYIDKFR